MRFHIVFKNSGDTIQLESINDDFLEFYVDWLNQNSLNNFKCLTNPAKKIKRALEKLHEILLCYEYCNLEKFVRYIAMIY